MQGIIKGRVWKFGDNVNTDVIIPGRYCHLTGLQELAKHVMEDHDPSFAAKVRPGDIILAGDNFGCGSSRELAPITIKAAGISCIVAKSFARIFYRNAINIGVPILESPECYDSTNEGDTLEVDLKGGAVRNSRAGKTFSVVPFPDFVGKIITAGGLLKTRELFTD